MTRPDFVKAIEALNGELQTNFAVLEMVKQERREQAHLRLQKTITFLQQSGMRLEGKASPNEFRKENPYLAMKTSRSNVMI